MKTLSFTVFLFILFSKISLSSTITQKKIVFLSDYSTEKAYISESLRRGLFLATLNTIDQANSSVQYDLRTRSHFGNKKLLEEQILFFSKQKDVDKIFIYAPTMVLKSLRAYKRYNPSLIILHPQNDEAYQSVVDLVVESSVTQEASYFLSLQRRFFGNRHLGILLPDTEEKQAQLEDIKSLMEAHKKITLHPVAYQKILTDDCLKERISYFKANNINVILYMGGFETYKRFIRVSDQLNYRFKILASGSVKEKMLAYRYDLISKRQDLLFSQNNLAFQKLKKKDIALFEKQYEEYYFVAPNLEDLFKNMYSKQAYFFAQNKFYKEIEIIDAADHGKNNMSLYRLDHKFRILKLN